MMWLKHFFQRLLIVALGAVTVWLIVFAKRVSSQIESGSL